MEKLDLTEEMKIIFKEALHSAYEAGKGDAIFLFNDMSELIEGEDASIKKVLKKYCEGE